MTINGRPDQIMMAIIESQLTSEGYLDLFQRIISHLSQVEMLNFCLRQMDSRQWTALYKAVIEVEAGL